VTDCTFSALGLAEPLQRALQDRNHTVPTPIQAAAIPKLIGGSDLLGIAQTGTGKTGAFALPILHHLFHNPQEYGSADNPAARPKNGRRRTGQARKPGGPAAKGAAGPGRPRALVLAPTRELAIQIGEEFRAYAQHMPARTTVIFGGVSAQKQILGLVRGVDIVVATPGRLLDLLNQGHIALDKVETLVLDEADRMLDMGFVRDVRKIIDKTPAARQSLLFSATMPAEIARLSSDLLKDPVRIELAPQSTPIERIAQSVEFVDSGDKIRHLADILKGEAMQRVIVFTRTKHRANRVAQSLQKALISADAIHGNKSQGARQRALKQFRSGECRVLVATDIAARGIDVDGISHVINFEIPNEPETYVHRIGRTARAGESGVAIALCDRSEFGYLRDIEKLTGCTLARTGDVPEGFKTASAGKKRHKPGRGPKADAAGGESRTKPRRRRPRRGRPQGGDSAFRKAA